MKSQTRRSFLVGAAAPLALAVPAWASPRCVADPKLGAALCKAYIDVKNAFQETYHARHEPGAIWIACVAVVFAIYGHVIQQPRIAEEAYGDFDKVSLDAGVSVTKALTRDWKDDDGVPFKASLEPLFDSEAPGAKFDQNALIQAVSNGDPLILVGGEHPVVLTAVAYAQKNAPDRLVAGFVFDPMPLIGPRALDIDEVVPQSAGGDLRWAVRTRIERV
ncbi:MAG: hypothetical protein JO366_05345 [Methylobacteriaceae bacterium]|nr:hypothetical protein [Methylobacteriaceae bacterium]MBV9244219.1 hypothetical protein [Methylobacteriaceae bacterium]MBV9635608.1 hypothetical protein [Methylobacteriaceae bacterium]MBV9702915.1 hypothetical protein [Methylobacteriaceae bacterium]